MTPFVVADNLAVVVSAIVVSGLDKSVVEVTRVLEGSVIIEVVDFKLFEVVIIAVDMEDDSITVVANPLVNGAVVVGGGAVVVVTSVFNVLVLVVVSV